MAIGEAGYFQAFQETERPFSGQCDGGDFRARHRLQSIFRSFYESGEILRDE
jgi:hypothetical protein